MSHLRSTTKNKEVDGQDTMVIDSSSSLFEVNYLEDELPMREFHHHEYMLPEMTMGY